MDKNALFDLVFAAIVTFIFTWTMSAIRIRVSDGVFRGVNAGLAACLILLASVIWKTTMLNWLFGVTPTFLPAVLVLLAVASIQAATRPLDRIEEPRLGQLGRRLISKFPVNPEWTDRLLTWLYAFSQNHFTLSATRVVTDVIHSETSPVQDHSEYSFSMRLFFGGISERNFLFLVEVMPHPKPNGEDRSKSFGTDEIMAGRDTLIPTIVLHPLLGDEDVIQDQLNRLELFVEVSDENGHCQQLECIKDEKLNGNNKFGARRRYFFDCKLRGPKARMRVFVNKLLHTNLLPALYFQPQVLALDEWELNVGTSGKTTLQYPTVVACQLPIGGEVTYESKKLTVAHQGGLQLVDGRVTHVPVMPWTTVQYVLTRES